MTYSFIMRIVFYSSNSNYDDSEYFEYYTYPNLKTLWEEFCQMHPDDEFICVSQAPAMFMPPDNYIIIGLHEELTTSDLFVQKIIELKPDLVIALSFWVKPYDWLPVLDAMIADELRNKGVNVICHSKKTALTCFDKYQTMNFFNEHNFNHAPGFFVDHNLFFCSANQSNVRLNVYQEYILKTLREEKYPLIIKNPVGLSSYGMTVVNSYNEAYGYIFSKKNNSNRIIERYLPGEQFGVEIYGSENNYIVMPPFSFSVNKYGITIPKLCIKEGPVTDEKYELGKLKAELKRLASALKLNGFAQVDLVWSNDTWYIIEINPRLSGMTTTYAASAGLNLYEYLYRAATGQILPELLHHVVNEKIPIQNRMELEEISQDEEILFVSQIKNLMPVQERERGYCEIIYHEASSKPFCTTRP